MDEAVKQVCLACLMVDVKGDFADRHELRLRGQIEATLAKLSFGECVGRGSGMGSMDLDFLVSDEGLARAAITQAMDKEFPDVRYTLDFTMVDGEDADFLPPSGGGCARAGAYLAITLMAVGGTAYFMF